MAKPKSKPKSKTEFFTTVVQDDTLKVKKIKAPEHVVFFDHSVQVAVTEKNLRSAAIDILNNIGFWDVRVPNLDKNLRPMRSKAQAYYQDKTELARKVRAALTLEECEALVKLNLVASINLVGYRGYHLNLDHREQPRKADEFKAIANANPKVVAAFEHIKTKMTQRVVDRVKAQIKQEAARKAALKKSKTSSASASIGMAMALLREAGYKVSR